MDKKQKTIASVGGAVAVVAIAGIWAYVGMNKENEPEKKYSAEMEQIIEEKQVDLKEVKDKDKPFISMTGDNLEKEDFEVIAKETKGTPVYWTTKHTDEKPVDFDDSLFGYINYDKGDETPTYSQFVRNEVDPEEAPETITWFIDGDASATQGDTLSIKAKSDVSVLEEDAIKQGNLIFEMTDNLNEKKTYKTQHLTVETPDNELEMQSDHKNVVKVNTGL